MNHNISFVSPRKENYLIMNTSNSELNLDALMEELEQENFNLDRELELVQLKINSVDEEIQYEEELMMEENQKILEEKEELKRQIMVESNRMFQLEESSSNLDESSCHNLSTSYLDASTLNLSTMMEASICEPEEITTLSNELKENEMKLRETKSKLEDKKIQLQEIRNENLLSENEHKKYRHEHKILRDEFKEREEELIMINSEMSLLPKLNQTVSTPEDSIYTELVRKMEVTKAELNEKKQKMSHYVSVLQQIESECKHFEGEILVLDVYDRDDEIRRLQSQANVLEAYKNFHKELDKNIQTLQTSASDLPAMLCSNSNSGLLLRSVNQYIDYVSVRLKKLTHDLTYHRLELASVEDKECQLMSNVKLLRGETLKMRSEMERLGREIENVKSGVKISAPELMEVKSTQPATVKPKSVRFETPTKEMGEESENKENEESKNNQEEEKKPMEKVGKQPLIVIHKRRQNRKPVNIIKHY